MYSHGHRRSGYYRLRNFKTQVAAEPGGPWVDLPARCAHGTAGCAWVKQLRIHSSMEGSNAGEWREGEAEDLREGCQARVKMTPWPPFLCRNFIEQGEVVVAQAPTQSGPSSPFPAAASSAAQPSVASAAGSWVASITLPFGGSSSSGENGKGCGWQRMRRKGGGQDWSLQELCFRKGR
jgi:hypothetical protein